MESSKKNKFLEIPIVSHNSEKPSLIFEEMSSGKLYPSKSPSKTDTKSYKKCDTNTNKKFIEIPIKSHESEKPSIVFEEISFMKIIPKTQTPIVIKSHQKNLKTVKKGKYAEIPVIAHDSEKPSICYEEDCYGKINSYIQDSMTFNNQEKENKNQISFDDLLENKGMQVSLGCVTTTPCLEFKKLSKDDNVFFMTPSASNDEVLEEAKRIFNKHEKRGELKNIILSVSGLVDINNPSDDKKALLGAFNKAFKDVPTFLTNDGDLFAYAELSKGKLKDVKDALFVYLNYGIGGSLIINNEM